MKMKDWLRQYPFVFLLFFQVVIIVLMCQSPAMVALVSRTDVEWLDSASVMTVWVRHIPSERQKTMLVDAEVLTVADSAGVSDSRGRIRLYIHKDSLSEAITQGDILLVGCRPVRPAPLSDGFDYGRYLQLQGIAAQAFVDSLHWRQAGHRSSYAPTAVAERMRGRLLVRLHRIGLSQRNEAILAALTLGYRDNIDAESRSAFASSGAMHILAVSGLHVGIICVALLWLLTFSSDLRRVAWRNRRLRLSYVIIIAALWFYAFLTGLSPSVTRATLMCSLTIAALLIPRPVSSFNIIAASAFLSLCVNPLALMSVSFQLSYAAVLSIVTIGRGLTELVRINNKMLRWVYDLMAISVAAQLGTMPLTLYYFGFLSNYFLLTNFVVIPAAWLLVVVTAAALLLSGVPVVGMFTGKVLNMLTSAVFWVLQHIEHLHGATTHCRFTAAMSLMLFVAIACCYLMFYRRKLWWAVPVAACLAAIVVLFGANMLKTERQDELRIGTTVERMVAGRAETLSADSSVIMFQWKDKTFVSLSGEQLHHKKTSRPLHCDYLITGALGRTQPAELLECIRPDTLIISAATGRYKAAMLAGYCEEKHIPYKPQSVIRPN